VHLGRIQFIFPEVGGIWPRRKRGSYQKRDKYDL